jgi:peptide/nickel transport system substrate-binding protein
MADLLDLLVAMPISPESELHRLPDQYVGSGPYRIKEQTGSRTILEAHDEYWGLAPEYQELLWIAEPSSEKRTEAQLNGEADVVTRISIQDKERIENDGGAQAFELQSGLCIIFMCNAQQGVSTDRRVR